MADKTWFDYFVSGAALSTGAYTLYKNFFERAKISILPGDRMSIVRGPGGSRRVHLRCVLVNDASKNGALQRLEVDVTGPHGSPKKYLWNELFEFAPGTTDVRATSLPQPIPISGKNSRLLLCQLELVEPNTPATWTAGRHKIEVLGWVNRRDRLRPANANAVFHINISPALASALSVGQPNYTYEDVPIEEWGA